MPINQTLIHTRGRRTRLDELVALNFTHILEPSTLSPEQDGQAVAAARSVGMGVWFDVSRACRNWSVYTWQARYRAWRDAVKGLPGLAGAFVADSPHFPDDGISLANYTAMLADLRAAGIPTLAAFSTDILRENKWQVWLNKADAEMIPAYSLWGGLENYDAGDVSNHVANINAFAGGTVTWNTLTPRVTETLGVWMQGFYDARWGATDANRQPTAADWQTLTDAMNAYASPTGHPVYRIAGYYGLAPAPKDRRDLSFIGGNPALMEEVAYHNARLLGLLHAKPRRAVVRCGGTVALQCTLSGATYVIESGPAGSVAYPSGVIAAGDTAGTIVVKVTHPSTARIVRATISAYLES